MRRHCGGAFAWQHPVGVVVVEFVNLICAVAAVHQGQIDHCGVAAGQLEFRIHDGLYLFHRLNLAARDKLACHVVAPRANDPVKAVLLHIDAAGYQLRP